MLADEGSFPAAVYRVARPPGRAVRGGGGVFTGRRSVSRGARCFHVDPRAGALGVPRSPVPTRCPSGGSAAGGWGASVGPRVAVCGGGVFCASPP